MSFKKIHFVTDSTCDLPPNVLERYPIGVVPCFINFGERSFRDDGVELPRDDFYVQLARTRPVPTTAAPPPGLAEQVIYQMFEDADHLIILTAPAKLSGIYNTMRIGMSGLPSDRVTLIDSGNVTMGLGFQVFIAAEVAAETGSIEQVLNAITGVRAHQRVYAALATLEYLRHGGRVGWAAAGIGKLLQIKPIVEAIDGEVYAVARVRTFSRAVEELIHLAHAQAPLDRLAILHTHNLDGALDLQARLGELAPPDTMIVNITPTVGTHVGPGGLGIATVSTAWRNA